MQMRVKSGSPVLGCYTPEVVGSWGPHYWACRCPAGEPLVLRLVRTSAGPWAGPGRRLRATSPSLLPACCQPLPAVRTASKGEVPTAGVTRRDPPQTAAPANTDVSINFENFTGGKWHPPSLFPPTSHCQPLRRPPTGPRGRGPGLWLLRPGVQVTRAVPSCAGRWGRGQSTAPSSLARSLSLRGGCAPGPGLGLHRDNVALAGSLEAGPETGSPCRGLLRDSPPEKLAGGGEQDRVGGAELRPGFHSLTRSPKGDCDMELCTLGERPGFGGPVFNCRPPWEVAHDVTGISGRSGFSGRGRPLAAGSPHSQWPAAGSREGLAEGTWAGPGELRSQTARVPAQF